MTLVTEDWYFLSHRLPMALAAQRAGYDVHVATRVKRDGDKIKQYGFTLHALPWQRGSLNPLRVLSVIVTSVRSTENTHRILHIMGFAAGDHRLAGGHRTADRTPERVGRAWIWIHVNEP